MGSEMCIRDSSCTTSPSLNFPGCKTPLFCREHAEDGMVNVTLRYRSHGARAKSPSLKLKGTKRPAVRRQRSERGKANVGCQHCSRDPCPRFALFNVEGSTTGLFCNRHAVDGMVKVSRKRCSRALGVVENPDFSSIDGAAKRVRRALPQTVEPAEQDLRSAQHVKVELGMLD